MSSITIEKAQPVIDSAVNAIRILHVDDDHLFLDISEQILKDADERFVFDFAFCVDEAFKKIGEKEYDVIISDYDMPGKSGLVFLKELKEQGNLIPFVLFTGKSREEVAISALNLGANGYVASKEIQKQFTSN